MNIYDRIINILLESRIEDYLDRLDERRRSRNRGLPRDGSAPVKETPEKRAEAKAASKKGRPEGRVKVKPGNKAQKRALHHKIGLHTIAPKTDTLSDIETRIDRTKNAEQKAEEYPGNQPDHPDHGPESNRDQRTRSTYFITRARSLINR